MRLTLREQTQPDGGTYPRVLQREGNAPPQYPGSDLGFLHVVPNITDQVSDHWSGYLLLVLYVASQLLSTLLTPIARVTSPRTRSRASARSSPDISSSS